MGFGELEASVYQPAMLLQEASAVTSEGVDGGGVMWVPGHGAFEVAKMVRSLAKKARLKA